MLLGIAAGVHCNERRAGSVNDHGLVFANAGIAKYSRLGEITEDFYDSIFDTNS
jgi:hypothetical protein